MAGLCKMLGICLSKETMWTQQLSRMVMRHASRGVAHPLPSTPMKRSRPQRFNSNNRGRSIPSRTWNIPKGVQTRLRTDALCGGNFSETLFHITYPVVHNEHQQALLDRYSRLNIEGKKEILQTMDTHQIQSFLEELAVSKNMELSSQDCMLISEVCLAHLNSTNLTESLRLTDYLYVCECLSDAYIGAFFNKVQTEWPSPDLDTSKFLQLLFYIGVYRSAPLPLMNSMEQYLSKTIVNGNFTLAQIGLICHAFFASNHGLKNYVILEAIAKQACEQLEDVQLYLICNIMKVLHHAGYSKSTFYESLATQLTESGMIRQDKRMSNLSNIISSFAAKHHSHKGFFRAVSDRAEELLMQGDKRCRFKDLARIIWSFRNLQMPVSNLLVQELERQVKENDTIRIQYPMAFTEGILALAMADIYTHDQISYVLSQQFEEVMTRRRFEHHYQRLLLDAIVQTECPEYNGNRLPTGYIMSQRESRKSVRGLSLHTRQGLATSWLTLEKILGRPSYVKCHFITDFSKVIDLELRIGADGSPLEWHSAECDVEEEQLRKDLYVQLSRSSTHGEQEEGVLADLLRERKISVARKEAPNLHLLPKGTGGPERKVTIKVLSENQYVSNEPVLLGVHELELQVLSAIGYEVLLINPKDAARLDEAGPEKRINLVNSLILKPLGIEL